MDNSSPRIVSLSPAMTEMLHGAGLSSFIVGRSAFCRRAMDAPVIGDLAQVNIESLVRVSPTHVFIQRSDGDLPAGVEELAVDHGWMIINQHMSHFADVQALLFKIGEAFPSAQTACMVSSDAIQKALRSRGGTNGPSVLVLGGGPHPLAWGTQTYLGELVEAAGGRNLIDGRAWVTLSLEEIVRAEPDLILVPAEAEDVDLSAIRLAAPQERIQVLVAEGIDLPGPHLAHLASRIDDVLSRSAAYTEP
ncbi:MAG: ABC transporter substrate-binding protein [Phycisphaerales bacterium]|nr:ABC transporter substrate-binding protein [Phycisphaerales bacterium]